ncbi:transmembrane protein [Cricetulus griseus]|uniref:Transmembrane protein n=1 Tax=Cricetulus griseus TaxID=10029 RepID=A0A061ILY0_CRIGR|nr:transmembrane protein [Cricetulus griseus]
MRAYIITDYMGIRNESFMKLAAVGTWMGDFVTAWMIASLLESWKRMENEEECALGLTIQAVNSMIHGSERTGEGVDTAFLNYKLLGGSSNSQDFSFLVISSEYLEKD